MTVEKMINFNIQECVKLLRQETEAKIINGIYTVSLKSGVELNEEEIKKMLLMFKPMQEELRTYKKALEMACERIMEKELSSICEFKCDKCKYYPNDCVLHTKANIEYYLKKARGQE